ncbi:periplasmic binding protein-like I [Zopfochytrium polystomum]|nr:periplasmic binding protein-like I [Zopfochytrium polystomum]
MQLQRLPAVVTSRKNTAAAVVTALLAVLACCLPFLISVPRCAAQKADKIKVAAVLGFYVPPNGPTGPFGALSLSLSSMAIYQGALNYVYKVNNDSSILPGVKIELVPVNSFSQRGQVLKGAIKALEDNGASAMIGEGISDMTITLATVASAYNSPLCMPSATSSLLSDKLAYPSAFRLATTSTLQANAIMRLVSSRNFSNIAVFTLNDDFGTGMLSSLEGAVAAYNITLRVIATGDRLTTVNWEAFFDQAIIRGIQVIVFAMQFNYVVPFLRAADRKGMLNGDYWFVTTTSWNQNVFVNDADLLPKIIGIWQVEAPTLFDYNPTGATQDAQGLYAWWKTLYRPNTGSLPGFPAEFSFDQIVMYNAATPAVIPPSRCNNDSMLSIAAEINPFPVGTVTKGNDTYVQAVVGNQCYGKGMYPQSWFVVLAKALGYGNPTPYFEVGQGYRCMKLTVAMMDYLLKNGVPLSKIQDRSAFTGLNFTSLINNITVDDPYGGTMYADSHGDVQSDQSINIFLNTTLGVISTTVGNWSVRTGELTYFDGRPLVFLGGKTAPPTPPTIPNNEFPAKMGLRYGVDAVVVLCSLFSFATVAFMAVHMNLKVFKASSPAFLILMVIGANISYAGVIYFSVYPMNNSSCIAHVWLKYLGFAAAFGALIVKTFRISVIFGSADRRTRRSNNSLNKSSAKSGGGGGGGAQAVKLTDATLLLYFGVFFAGWLALMVVWTALESFRPRLVTEVIANVAVNGSVIAYICLVAMALTLAYGAFLTNSVKKLPSAFNESKWLGIAIYNWVVIGIVLNAISDFAVQDPDVIFVMDALMAIITQTSVVGLLMVPKILACLRGEGDMTGLAGNGVGLSKNSLNNLTSSSHGKSSTTNATQLSQVTSGGGHGR